MEELLRPNPIVATQSIKFENEDNSPKTDPPKKEKRVIKRVSRACVACQKGHLSCDNGRPCKKCIERGRECIDGESKRRGRKKRGVDDEEETIQQDQILQNFAQINETNPTLYNQMMGQNTSVNDLMGMLRDYAPMDLPQESISIFSEVFLAPYEHPNKRPKNLSAENYFANHLLRFKRREEALKIRLPDLAQKMAPHHHKVVSTFKKIQQQYNHDVLLHLLEETEHELKVTIEKYSDLGAPVLVWEKGSTLLWANQAYTDMTGLEVTKFDPDDITNDVTYLDEMDETGLRQSLLAGFKCMMTHANSSTFNCGLRNHKEDGPEYIHGTLNVSIKRSVIGPPLLFIGIFLPSKVEMITSESIDWNRMDNILDQKCTMMMHNLAVMDKSFSPIQQQIIAETSSSDLEGTHSSSPDTAFEG
eukprot:TRINITY_DN1459_c0_g2_i1.p1 TRINITY_DN1459_c0_g2~~TRINITY_DN1459_c0_g2_i1.p1  ORF type:complete len:447 (-),score=70.33 TRINITY_DN1459_c0_g2_i1:154-1407(-)